MRNNRLIVVGALTLVMGACLQTYAPEQPKGPEPPPPVPETATGASTEALPVRPVDPSQDAADCLGQGDASRLLDIISVEGTPEQASPRRR